MQRAARDVRRSSLCMWNEERRGLGGVEAWLFPGAGILTAHRVMCLHM